MRRLFSAVLTLLATLALGARAGHAQAAAPGAFRAEQRVEVEYIPDSGRWLPATVVEVVNDGYSYKVSLSPGGDGRMVQTNIHFKRVRAAAAAPAPIARPAPPAPPSARVLAPGRYGCTSSAYSAASGAYEYTPRGSFEVATNGAYRYHGLRNPSAGRYTYDATAGKIAFQGGYLNRGVATAMEDRPGRFYLVFPTIPGGRWTCGLQ